MTGVDEGARKEAAYERRFWIISPNVGGKNKTSDEWVRAICLYRRAFMGWGPGDPSHRLGCVFAYDIKPGDIVLIARSHSNNPQVVGYGVVEGTFETDIDGLELPVKQEWNGSYRRLSPFIQIDALPEDLRIMDVLRHNTSALLKMHPEKAEKQRHKAICDWLLKKLESSQSANRRARSSDVVKRVGATLSRLPNDSELEYQVRTRQEVKKAQKAEAALVKAYTLWLKKQDRALCSIRYRGSLRCDLYECKLKHLIEAKCSTSREHIRMAVGQLLDYSHLGRKDLGKPEMAILLPGKPAKKIVEWLKVELNISVIWQDGSKFRDNANERFV